LDFQLKTVFPVTLHIIQLSRPSAKKTVGIYLLVHPYTEIIVFPTKVRVRIRVRVRVRLQLKTTSGDRTVESGTRKNMGITVGISLRAHSYS